MLSRDQKWKTQRIIQQAANIHKINKFSSIPRSKAWFYMYSIFFSSVRLIITACKNINVWNISFAWKSYAVTSRAQPQLVCTVTVHIHVQMKSVCMRLFKLKMQTLNWKTTTCADAKVQCPCWFFWLLSEHSSWTKQIQCQLWFDDSKIRVSSYWYFSVPKYKSNVFLAWRVFLLMPHKILDEINALC